MIGLKEKVVLITGASRGIGRAAALIFSRYGARVAVNYHLIAPRKGPLRLFPWHRRAWR